MRLDEFTAEMTNEILKQIDELPKPALIHCGVAMRAGAMALMHLATRQNLTPEQTFELAGKIGFDCSAHPKAKEFFKHYVETH